MDTREKSRLLTFAGAVVADPKNAAQHAATALAGTSSDAYRRAVTALAEAAKKPDFTPAPTDAAAAGALEWARSTRAASRKRSIA
jgi:hypothetical protein